MEITLDHYSETNWSGTSVAHLFSGGTYIAAGQSFAPSQNSKMGACKFYISKFGSPTGTMVAKLYLTTQLDTNPTTSAVATSEPVDVSTVVDSASLGVDAAPAAIRFTFNIDNQYSLLASPFPGSPEYYVVTVEYSGGDASNFLILLADGSAPTHQGRAFQRSSLNVWHNEQFFDAIFYVYSTEGALPVYNTSLVSSVQKVAQNLPFPQYVIGGRNAGSYALFKKTTTQYGTVISIWRSPVYQIGKNFDVTKIKFAITNGVTGNKAIIPVLYFDNASSSSAGTPINTTDYINSDKLITLSSHNFSNSVHGTNNFFLELQMTGAALSVVKLPITIDIDVQDV